MALFFGAISFLNQRMRIHHPRNHLIDLPQYLQEPSPDMKPAAIGVRSHSGWAALVTVSNAAGKVEVIDRRRVAVTAPGTRGASQPYHFAESLEFSEAETFLG